MYQNSTLNTPPKVAKNPTFTSGSISSRPSERKSVSPAIQSKTPPPASGLQAWLELVGLDHNPFATEHATKEIATPSQAKATASCLEQYFVRPPRIEVGQDNSALIFGRSGFGKTASCLYADFALRQQPGPVPTLVFLFMPEEKDFFKFKTLAEWLSAILENHNVLSGLLLQISERVTELPPLQKPKTETLEQLRNLLAPLGDLPRFLREKGYTEDAPAEEINLRAWVYALRRLPVSGDYKNTEKLKQFYTTLLRALARATPVKTPQERLQQWVRLARAQGFGRIALVVDGFPPDAEPERLLKQVKPILEHLLTEPTGVLWKLFLPETLEPLLKGAGYDEQLMYLTGRPEWSSIFWPKQFLQQLIEQRLRVASAGHIVGLAGLAEVGLREVLVDELLERANQSARVCINWVNALFEIHASHPDDYHFSQADWETVKSALPSH